jgi:hypothetical protein
LISINSSSALAELPWKPKNRITTRLSVLRQQQDWEVESVFHAAWNLGFDD